MKLNGWQRIGVVASVLWGVGAGIYERRGQAQNNLSLDFASVLNIVFVAVGPVLAGWILAYLTVKIVRWVKAGF